MSNEVQKIIADLKAGKPKPIYLLMGEESFYIDQISDYIENKFLQEHEREFNQTVLYGLTTSAEELISVVKRYPMMAEHQVVILKEAQLMKELEKAEPIFSNPVKTTVLVIAHKHKTLDKRTKAYNQIKANGVILQADKLKENLIPDWISNYCKQQGIGISNAARDLLANHLGNDLDKITGALDKLAIVVSKTDEITPADIEKNIGISKDYNVFELQNAFGKRDMKKTFTIVKYVLDNPKTHNTIMMLGLLNSFFGKVYQYHFVADKSKAAAEMKINPYAIRDYTTAATNYPIFKLEEIFGHLRDADLKLKGVGGSSAHESLIFEELTFKILN